MQSVNHANIHRKRLVDQPMHQTISWPQQEKKLRNKKKTLPSTCAGFFPKEFLGSHRKKIRSFRTEASRYLDQTALCMTSSFVLPLRRQSFSTLGWSDARRCLALAWCTLCSHLFLLRMCIQVNSPPRWSVARSWSAKRCASAMVGPPRRLPWRQSGVGAARPTVCCRSW